MLTPADAISHELFVTFKYTWYVIAAEVICQIFSLNLFWPLVIIILVHCLVYDDDDVPDNIPLLSQLMRAVVNFFVSLGSFGVSWLLLKYMSKVHKDFQPSEAHVYVLFEKDFNGICGFIVFVYSTLLCIFSVIRTAINLFILLVKILFRQCTDVDFDLNDA